MKLIKLKFHIWFKYGLKAQKFQKQHALKGQKLLAQGVWGKTCETSVNQQLLEKSEYHFLALVDVDFAAFHTFHPLSCKSIVGSIAAHLKIRNRGELDA